MTMGRTRGRPRKTVPSPSTPTHTIPAHVDSHTDVCPTPIAEEVVFEDHHEAIPTSSTKHSDPPQLWVDVLSGNRNPVNGLTMEYVAPKRVWGD
jgi:hypothetical protein